MNKNTKISSSYELFARYIPAILTGIPFLLIGFYLTRRTETKELVNFLLSLKFFGYLSFSIVLLYCYAQIIRTTSKTFEKAYFQNERGFPTTYLMLYSDPKYSDSFKDAFRQRVQEVMGMTLCTKEEEKANPNEAIRKLNEITKQIILQVGDGVLVGKHNQWYGFFRNLIGGSIYAAIISAVNILLGILLIDSKVMTVISIILCFIYFSLFVARRTIIVQHAEAYAQQLIAEFMKT